MNVKANSGCFRGAQASVRLAGVMTRRRVKHFTHKVIHIVAVLPAPSLQMKNLQRIVAMSREIGAARRA